MTPPGTMAPVETKSAPASPQHHHQHHHHLQQPMMPIPVGKKEGLGYASGLLNPISSCFSFILPGIFRRPQTDSIASYTGDDWEIPFESITNLEWLGAGSQGAVFTGKLNAQVVAVKKVKELRDTETSHLRHLAHRNIVKFMGVCTQAPCFCLVMEFCSNGQLNELLSGGQPIPHQRWVDMARQVAAVGSGKLALPMPTMLPDGLRMLIQQCWSQKPRNRPSFQGVLQHLDILGNELAGWGEAKCNRMYQKLTTLLEELDVREKELLGRERDLAIREGRHYRGGSFSGPLNHRGAVVVRAGPRSHRGEATADVFSTHVAHPSLYGADDGMSSSSGEEQLVRPPLILTPILPPIVPRSPPNSPIPATPAQRFNVT
ncbi:unnamed protein product, partial [Mesorhabditis spiculigera]